METGFIIQIVIIKQSETYLKRFGSNEPMSVAVKVKQMKLPLERHYLT